MPATEIRTRLAQFPSSGTAPFDVTIPGESRFPTGCLAYGIETSTLENFANGIASLYSISEFTTFERHTNFFSDRNNQTPPELNSEHQSANHWRRLSQNPPHAVIQEALFARIPGGITITPAQAGSAHFIMVVLVFGSACKVFSAGDGTLENGTFDVNHGFGGVAGAGVYFLNRLKDETELNFARQSIGFHSDNGVGIQMCSHHYQTEETIPTNNAAAIRDDSIGGIISPAGDTQVLINISANVPGTTTFEVLNNDLTGDLIGLLIECDDIQADARIIASPTVDNVDFVNDAPQFEPQAFLMIPSKCRDLNEDTNDSDAGTFSFYSADLDGFENSMGWRSINGGAGESQTRSNFFNKILYTSHGNNTSVHDMNSPVFTEEGWLYEVANIDKVDNIIRLWPSLTFEKSGGVQPPIVSNPVDFATGIATSTGEVDTDKPNNGGIFAVVTQSDITPTHAQITAGQDHTGAMADASQAVQAFDNPQVLNFTGLVADTDYFTHFTQEDSGDLESIPISADGFTTSASNQPPVAEGDIPDQVGTIGEVYPPLDTAPFFSDPDGDPLTHTQDNLPNGLDIDEAGLITGTPTGGFPFIETNTVIAGLDGDFRGFALAPVTGSINPATFGLESISKFGNTIAPSTPDMVFEVVGIDFEETSWKQIEIVGDFGSGIEQKTWFRVADNFVYDGNVGGNSQWRSVAGVAPLLDGEIYLIQIVATVITE